MAQVKCKCGQLLAVDDGADQVTCPACQATYRVRATRSVQLPSAPEPILASPPPQPPRTGQAQTSPRSAAAAKIAAALSKRPATGPVVRQAPPPAPRPEADAEGVSLQEVIESETVAFVPSPPAQSPQAEQHDLPPVPSRPPSSISSARAIPLSAAIAARKSQPMPVPDAPAGDPPSSEWSDDNQVPASESESALHEAAPVAAAAAAAAPRGRSTGMAQVVARRTQPVKVSAPPTGDYAEGADDNQIMSNTPVRPKTGSAIRPGLRTSGKSKTIPQVDPNAPPSKAPLVVAGLGALMILGGIVVLAVNGVAKPDNSAKELAKKNRIDARNRSQAAMTALSEERRREEDIGKALRAAENKAKEYKMEDSMVDRRYESAKRGTSIEVAAKDLKAAEEEFQRSKDILEIKKVGEDQGKVIARSEKTVIVIRTNRGGGTGFVITRDGLACTNYHVIEGSTTLHVKIQKKDSRDQVDLDGAKIVAVDPSHDLALIQLPPAPDTVGTNGVYQVAHMRAETPDAGEKVIVIGNPGMEHELMTYTTTLGIVSNPSRPINNSNMIQTSAPVNPGNSGGPLFDASGLVLGVITLKGNSVEGIAFAVPSQHVKDLQENRNTEEHIVKSTLSDWEREKNPAMNLMFADKDVVAKYGTTLPEPCSDIQVSNDGKSLFLLYDYSGKIQEYSLEKNALGKIFDAGGPIDGMTIRAGSGQIAAVSNKKKKLFFLNPQTLAVEKEMPLQKNAHGISTLGGANDYIGLTVYDGSHARLVLVGNLEMAGSGDTGVELPKTLPVVSAAVNSKWTAFVGINPDTGHFVLRALPFNESQKQFSDWSAFRQKNTKQNDWQPKLDTLGKKLTDMEFKFELHERPDRGDRGGIMFADTDRLLFGKHAYKITDKKIEPDTEFEASPDLGKDDLTDGQKRMLAAADKLNTVTNDGKYAASLGNVYHTGTGKIMKKIPFICDQPVFSKDGKGLYMLDGSHNVLFRFDDWEKMP